MTTIETTLPTPIDAAEPAVRAALAEQGFGVLTEIDVAAVLHAKLGVERPPLKILGACNPTFAHQALEHDTGAALLLPCNVVLEPTTDGGTRVRIVDPRDLIAEPSLRDLADEAAAKLQAAVDTLGGAAA